MNGISKQERKNLVDAQRLVLGYQPLRMKPVHFATSFFTALTGRYFDLEILNKAANPKPVPRKPGGVDHYVTAQLIDVLREFDPAPLGDGIQESDFGTLRNHLNSVFNNDGAALAPGYAPYSTFGFDFSTPGPEYLANKSKNHGNAGALAFAVLSTCPEGEECLDLCRRILNDSKLPARQIAKPILVGVDSEAPSPLDLIPDTYCATHAAVAAHEMRNHTEALRRLLRNVCHRQSAYALRQMLIGVGSWLVMYLLRRSSAEGVVVVPDFTGDRSSRMRIQSRACFSRHQTLFGSVMQTQLDEGRIPNVTAEQEEAIRSVDPSKVSDFEEHLNDFALRLGWLQPRAGSVAKHYEILPDTLKVLIQSVLEPGEVIVLEELGERLLASWNLCLGLRPEDHALLRQHGYSPLDLDADLRRNRDAFKRRIVALGLAQEPSDGLVLVSLDQELIHSR